jgi:uncharacterized protein (DUF1778 family)
MTALRAEDSPQGDRQPRQKRKTAQVIVRMDPDQKAFLVEAAAASGRTLTDLITEGAREKAIQIFREEEEITKIKLSRADAIALVGALLAEPKPTEQMYRDWGKYLEMKEKYFVPEPQEESFP